LNGEPFRFIGANSIYFGFYKEYGYSIEDAIKSAKESGIRVLRVYLGFGESTWGQKPMEEYDKALDIAAENGMYVIAVLTDCCCFGGDWGNTQDKYYSHVPYCSFNNTSGLSAYKAYIKSILLRTNTVNGKVYKDDPTIMAWDVANEPTFQFSTDPEFHAWLTDVTSYIKSIDPKHLLTIGIDNSGNLYDAGGPQYDVLNVPDLDFFSIHFNLNDATVVSSQLLRLQFRVQKFLSMGKPVILEEFGTGTMRRYPGMDPLAIAAWVMGYKDQMDVVFSSGGSGAIFWGWGVPETANVPLWWNQEDHNITETDFVAMIKNYQYPALGSMVISTEPLPDPNDNFDGTVLNTAKWQVQVDGGGNVNQDGRLIFSTFDSSAFSTAGVSSTWSLSGDFDIQVDYEIGAGWRVPSNDHLDGAVLGVSIAGADYHLTHILSINQDGIYAWSGGASSLTGNTPSTAASGKYRLVRKGTDLTMFYDEGNGWQEVDHVNVPSDKATVYLRITSVNASQAFTTYFDNFKVNSGTVITQ
jgi:mannan endo-1,4-beta-mannosidase